MESRMLPRARFNTDKGPQYCMVHVHDFVCLLSAYRNDVRHGARFGEVQKLVSRMLNALFVLTLKTCPLATAKLPIILHVMLSFTS